MGNDTFDPDVHELEADRLSRALDLRDAGHSDWLEQACAGDPQAMDEVRAAVESADSLSPVFTSAFATDTRVGATISDRYLIQRRLGSGAMGVVYEAEDRSLDRRVAIKILRPGLMDQHRSVERFDREARAMAAVVHPAVLAIHDRGRTDDGEAYLVMELIAGQQLGALVEGLSEIVENSSEVDANVLRRALGFNLSSRDSYLRFAARWVAQLAAGLTEAHGAGVVHRDVKPSNVLIRRDGRAVLVDFGIAHLVDGVPLTAGDTSIGTPAFMAPELLASDRRVTPLSDVYGLAAVLYCLLALRPPYVGTPHEVLLAVATRSPIPLARLAPGLPRDLVAIVEKGMSRRPAQRYASAAELERDLRAFLDHRPVVARPVGPLRRALRRARHSKIAWGAGGALALVAAVLLTTTLRASYLAQRQATWLELSRHFPPNFTILNPENRVYVHESDRAAVAQLLDRAAAVCVDPLPTLLLRAFFRLDHGDNVGAAQDMAAIARHENTDFARKLAEAYARVAPGAAGSDAVDLTGLPEPRTARDRYLRAYHHLRAFEDPQAEALLDVEVVAAIPDAQGLLFALQVLDAYQPPERHQRALELHGAVLDYEDRIGTRTATSAHYVSYALGFANAYASALEVGLESIELAPRSHVNRTNAGWAAFALGEHDLARELLAVAADIRPNDVKPVETTIWTYVAEGDFDAALAVIDARGPMLDRVLPWWGEDLAGAVESYQALAHTHGAEKSPLAAAAVARAREHFERARALGNGGPATYFQQVLDAIDEADSQALIKALAVECSRDPRRLWLLRLLQQHFPEQLDTEPSESLRLLLQSIDRELTGARVVPHSER
ncbi:serine/threonine-protein kinase [Engelhardtia mirabilis]|uniref:Serine/threonine-protein kinase PknH n=1 Tax=Engelhardtia mirabilis TaxID=2528011 RepID=A0A518BFB1_9BACT|nr:Serine/threonine-protein kinase PknH [Planctomycetes bacterium Pla133]QDU99993.1 Serine/threonine-protein kinase PknH [Planctomycetes bacterium Pla86]